MKTLTFILVAFIWSWVWWFLGLHYIAHGLNDQTAGPFVACLYAGIYGPTLGALVTTLSFGGLAELGALLKRVLVWRAPWHVYLFVFLLPFVCTGAAIGLYALFNSNPGKVDLQAGFALIPIVLWSALRGGRSARKPAGGAFCSPNCKNAVRP